jgi:hypothetical protein
LSKFNYILSKKRKSYVGLDRNKNLLFSEIYGKNKTLIDELDNSINHLKSEFNITDEDILFLLRNKKDLISLPISIFKSSLSPLEAVVHYLKTILKYKLHDIALFLNRDDRTIWKTYDNALKKNIEFEINDDIFLPLLILSDRRYSVLENITKYLKEIKGYSLRDIAMMLGKGIYTIRTSYQRAKKKEGLNER